MMSWRQSKQFTTVVLTVLLLVMSVAALYALSQGAKFLSVQSGSMVPTYHKGDLVVDMRVPAQQLAVGDVVTYTNPRLFNGEPITHRIIQTPSNDNGQQFVTKGDANPAADPPIKAHNIVGKVGFSVPLLGYLFDFVRKPLGLLILIYVPALTIIIAEIRRLAKYYKEREAYIAGGYDPRNPHQSAATGTTIKVIATAVAIAGLIIPSVQAALMNSVSLTGVTLQTAPQAPATPPQVPDHLLISQVSFSNGNNGATTTGSSNSTTNNTNNVSVTSNNSQTATSGRAIAAGGGSATSGNATNSSNTNININVSNGASNSSNPAGSPQRVTLFNPTSQPVNLANWQLIDNSTAQTISSGTIAANSSYVFTWPLANGLSNLGDHLVLRDPGATVVDSLSWGTDNTQLNPSVTTTSATTTISRKSPAIDTNMADDWQVAP